MREVFVLAGKVKSSMRNFANVLIMMMYFNSDKLMNKCDYLNFYLHRPRVCKSVSPGDFFLDFSVTHGSIKVEYVLRWLNRVFWPREEWV